MADIVIIGAGLTGLSAAYHLEQNGFYNYLLIEKEAIVGGLCRSVYQDGFTFDFAGHLLHVHDDYFRSHIEHVIGFENLNSIKRRSFIYSCGIHTRYPYQVNLYGLPPEIIAECIEGFAQRSSRVRKEPRTFYDWVMYNFGQGLGKHFFFPFQEKIFDYPVKKLSASWTGRFVPQTSLKEMIQGSLSDTHDEDIGYNSRFFYPKQGGIYFWMDRLHRQLRNSVMMNTSVQSIDLVTKSVTLSNGARETFKQLITTMPLDCLLSCSKESSRTNLRKALRYLRCNSVINFNMGVSIPELSQKHWIYYPESSYPFYRIGFAHNFSSAMAPAGCSSLYGEFSYLRKPQAFVLDRLQQAQAAVTKLFGIARRDIITEKVIVIPHAYVIYTNWRDRNLPSLLAQLEDYSVYSVGRYGAWKYSSMQEGLLDGKYIADKLTL